MFVVSMLSEKGNSTLGVVLIELGHVQIVNEVDELEFPWRTELLSCLLLQGLLQLNLEIRRVSVVVEVNLLV